jgi:hypothetical protein
MIFAWGMMSRRRTFAVLIVLAVALGARVAAAQTSEPSAIGESEAASEAAGLPRSPVFESEEFRPSLQPCWCFQADGLLLQRSVVSPRGMASVGTDSGAVAISANDLNGPFKDGSRLTIGHRLGDSPYQVEFSYFTIGAWNESKSVQDETEVLLSTSYVYQQLYTSRLNTVTNEIVQFPVYDSSGNPVYTVTATVNTYGKGNLFSPFTGFGADGGVAGYDYSYRVTVQQTSYLDNGELNLRRSLALIPEVLTGSVLIGTRYMGLREGLDYQSYSYLSNLGSTVEQNGSSLHVNTHTLNSLWGGQIGGLFEIYWEHGIWVDCGIKGAFCNNNMSQETDATLSGTSADYANRRHSKSASGMAYVIDMDLALVCRPWSHLTARAGYQVLWMSGLALASRNFSPDYQSLASASAEQSWIDTRGSVLYHGPHVGVEVAW